MTSESERVFRRSSLATLILAAGLVVLLAFAARAQEIATSDPALICGTVDGMSYSRQHRKLLLEDERRADFARYSVPWSEHRGYELDHWEPLCLGGADTPKNRRPQRCTQWRGIACIDGPAAKKDRVEWEACAEVCELWRIPRTRFGAMERLAWWQLYFANWKDW